jgi:NAD(P)-dependent dehydrogenase (short-subunit alcohol dehydrogenase family)
VITGAASGIGAACARRFADEGVAGIVLADVDADRGQPIADELSSRGITAIFAPVDVRDQSATQDLAVAAEERLGRIDVLVAAAGISFAGYVSGQPQDYAGSRSRVPLVDVELASWHQVMDVNLHGLFLTDQAVAQRMIAAGTRGSIVNITSINAERASVGTGAYSVSKAAAWMLTKIYALELAEHGIRVNAVGPGFIDTPMNDSLKRDGVALQRVLGATPMGRLGDAVDIANAALYLASDEARFVTGTVVGPDGGFIAATR